jgi:hypothetical protein
MEGVGRANFDQHPAPLFVTMLISVEPINRIEFLQSRRLQKFYFEYVCPEVKADVPGKKHT